MNRPPRRRRFSSLIPALIGTQRRAQEGHVIFRKERAHYFRVRGAAPSQRPELLIKLVSASGDVDHNNLPRFVCQVEEGLGNI